jgi:hypothetical protein
MRDEGQVSPEGRPVSPCGFMRCLAISLTLMLSAFPAYSQNGHFSQRSSDAAVSPLDGNWQITGNLEHKAYPAISMSIAVNGRQVSGWGTSKDVCPNGGSEHSADFRVAGTIEPDGSFHLRSPAVPYAVQLTFAGKVPAVGATGWDGSYTFQTVPPAAGQPCGIDRKGAFTASPLAPLTGAFSGQVMRLSPFPVAQGTSIDLINRTPKQLKLSIGVKQGTFLLDEGNTSERYSYLPLTGIIRVESCPCFAEGKMIAGTASRIGGQTVKVRFEMDDQSQIYFQGTYRGADEGLSFVATVTSGKCRGLGFSGTLNPE